MDNVLYNVQRQGKISFYVSLRSSVHLELHSYCFVDDFRELYETE